MSKPYPAYLNLIDNGELARRVDRAVQNLAHCTCCARRCGANRFEETDPKPFCRTGRYASVASCFPHHGEESCLRGSHGSGTIFFTNCNLRCDFCQNYEISASGEGRITTPDELAAMMLSLARQECHNINFVTPSHVVPQIIEALPRAAEHGLRLPLIYNTGSYDSLDTLKLLDGIVDIYMPDFKFWAPEVARELAAAEDYADVARDALREMHRQVGDLEIDDRGIARRGLLVRHLVMPNDQSGTRDVMRFLATEISPDTYVNVMGQYRPAGKARLHDKISRTVSPNEVARSMAVARQEGLRRFDVR